jgi:uncharacterized RDD family membrane protein YckC
MSGPAPDLVVDSVTGIDVQLTVAGPGVRSYAFLVDWHIRVILGFCWYATGALIYNGRLSLAPPADAQGWWFGLVLLPAAAIYFLYHYVLELALRGRTPGKRMAGVQLVARDGGAPSAGALLTRNVFRLLDSLPVCYGVGLLTVSLTREHLRVGDMAAGTLLVYERSDAALPAAAPPSGALDAAGIEIVHELLGRWSILDPEARSRLARQVLSRYAPALSEAASGDDSDEVLRSRLEGLARP